MVVFKIIMIVLDILLGLWAIWISDGNDEILSALLLAFIFIVNAILIAEGIHIGVQCNGNTKAFEVFDMGSTPIAPVRICVFFFVDSLQIPPFLIPTSKC